MHGQQSTIIIRRKRRASMGNCVSSFYNLPFPSQTIDFMPLNDTNVNTDNTASDSTMMSLCRSCREVFDHRCVGASFAAEHISHRPRGAERRLESPSQPARRSQQALASDSTYNTFGQASDQISVALCPRCQTQLENESDERGAARGSRSPTSSPSESTTTRSSSPRQLTPETARSLMPLLDIPPRATTLRTLSRQEEMSLTGLTVQQRSALACAEKKAQRSEAAARRSTEWTLGKGANCQKFDQLNNQMKWGKQNHKLMPR